MFGDFAFLRVGALDCKVIFMKKLGKSAHADAADAYKVCGAWFLQIDLVHNFHSPVIYFILIINIGCEITMINSESGERFFVVGEKTNEECGFSSKNSQVWGLRIGFLCELYKKCKKNPIILLKFIHFSYLLWYN